jgi:electron transport complex protein RnfC
MLEKTDELLEGISIVRKLLASEEVIFGIEENKPDAIEAVRAAVARRKADIKVVPLRVRYPQGDEKQLLKAVTGKEVPSGGLPIDIGCVVSNAGSVFAIYEAVVFDKPLIERCLTVTGSAIRNPANLKVRFGTPVGELIEDCGGFKIEPGKLVAGGPMMGFAFYDLDTPVTKGTSGILALGKNESSFGRETNCLSCGKCIASCAFGLSPTDLYKMIEHRMIEEAVKEGLMDCKECGCCAYVCPARIPLVQGLRLGKLLNRKMGAK